MEQPSTQLAKAGPGVPLVAGKRPNYSLLSTEADNTAGTLLPASASGRWREMVERFDEQEPKQTGYWD
eukprot:350266-Chlamydomonas_euryale.AAC.18